MITQLKPLLCTVLVLFCVNLSAQEQDDFKERYYKPDISKFESFVNEAYGEKANRLVFEHEVRLKTLKDFVENRLIIVERFKEIPIPNSFKKLSSIDLYNYNPNAQRDYNMNPETFNPLKYNFDLHQNERQNIHIDGTNFYLVIKPFELDRINQ